MYICANSFNTEGFVYYEADCFGTLKNPYIPPDVDNPSIAQVNQKSLMGPGAEERRAVCEKAHDMFMQIIQGEVECLVTCSDCCAGQEHDRELEREFYTHMCADINRERARIGGDWAIAAVTLNRQIRDRIRSVGCC